MSYGQACMVAPRDEYYRKIFETLIEYNDCHTAPLSSEKLQQTVSIVMAETEKVEFDAEHNKNNVTMDTFFNHYIISPSKGEIANVTSVHSTISSSQEDTNVTNERQISSVFLRKKQ